MEKGLYFLESDLRFLGTPVPHTMMRRNTLRKLWLCSLVACCAFLFVLTPLALGLGGWADPAGGWDRVYNDFDLDQWTHNNGSDAWDGSAPGDAGMAPGGVHALVISGEGDPSGDATVVSIEDTGDPRGDGFSDPSNRKIYLENEVAIEGNFYEGGITFIARLRVNPSPIDAPADGYTLHDGGKGNVGIVHNDAPGNLSFSIDTGGLLYFGNEDQAPLEIGDEFQFHSIWATAVMSGDLYTVNVYVDGSAEPAFSGDIALGDGSDGDIYPNYVAMGTGSTGRDAAIQVDYIGYKAGVHVPALATAVSPTSKLPVMWGELKSK
jgi:hypothetical protein